jgi:hypothetical protein
MTKSTSNPAFHALAAHVATDDWDRLIAFTTERLLKRLAATAPRLGIRINRNGY